MASDHSFHLFTSIRYDPLLLKSAENSLPILNYVSPSPFYMLIYHRDRMLEAAQHFDFHAVTQRLEHGESLHQELLQEVGEYLHRGGHDGPLKMRILFDKAANITIDFAPTPPVPLSTLYPASFDPPRPEPTPHPANPDPPTFLPSPLTGGALILGPTDAFHSNPPSEPPPPPEYHLRLDTQPTPTSAFTLLKTTVREQYDAARSRALPTNPAGAPYSEVILYNSTHELTEGTLTTIYVFRGGRWVTPPVGVPAGEFTAQTLKDVEGESADLDEGELRKPFAGRWGHSVRSAKVGAGGQRGTSRRWALKKGFCMEEPISVNTVEVGEGVWISSGVRGFAFGRVVE
ncbi:hypothetical protein P171DRAFT_421763 [Karstenula rhodostoma CBS 690.94]|uniref:Aminotransferase n=1 Tax=Karstenula rhodostoma CBS 690.94 TaxID=1392251 RepID=A0A9P4PA33_9PLEO|nr:hypothetical protein P171DRAFT_421763 [Karstenula rhodostoma CBS 690.94]